MARPGGEHAMDIERTSRFFEVAKSIVDEGASDAGSIAYVARVLAQVTMPHSKTDALKFQRANGNVTLSMVADPDQGLPFGTYPRLLMAWISTEAVRNRSPVLELGDSLSAFMRELGLIPTGGRWGSVDRLRNQLNRLTSSTISWTTERRGEKHLFNIAPIEESHLWWDPLRPDQTDLWKSTLTLNQRFYEALVEKPVPVDMRALRALASGARSALAIDIYTWLTYRLSYLGERTTIPWASLQEQFGGEYGRTRKFKEKFLERLKAVLELYPAARVSASDEPGRKGLVLEPSPPHVPKLKLLSS
jgi:Plasmid encoded RepA protein